LFYRHPENGAVIARCSQPEVGWLGWRSQEDERLLQAIGEACASKQLDNGIENGHLPNGHIANGMVSSTDKRVLILDARSYTAAVANRAKGGGCECTGLFYYTSTGSSYLIWEIKIASLTTVKTQIITAHFMFIVHLIDGDIYWCFWYCSVGLFSEILC